MKRRISKIVVFCPSVFTGTMFVDSCKYVQKKIKADELYRETTFAVIGQKITASLNVKNGMFSERSIENTSSL